VQGVFDTVTRNLLACPMTKFSLACCIDGKPQLFQRLIAYGIDLEDPPSRQLGYSLMKTTLRIWHTAPDIQKSAQQTLVNYLENCHDALVDAVRREGFPCKPVD
jgi:hypothetical protein